MFNRKSIFATVVIVLLVGFLVAWRFFLGQWSAGALVYSPQTTVIVDRLRGDGYPDYAGVLNERLSEGVTPENNAAVLLVRAMGHGEIPPKHAAEFFARLGIAPLSPAGDYFEDWPQYVHRIPESERPKPVLGLDALALLSQMQDEANERPWRREEFPYLAKWLDANETQVEMFVAASKRPRYYAPLILEGDPPSLAGCLLPLTQSSRQAGRALVARGMLRLGEGEFDAAWDDLMACRRLGRLIAQGGTLIDALVGYAVEGIAIAGQVNFVAEAKLTPAEWAALARELDELPAHASLADKLDTFERFGMLDMLLTVAEHGAKPLADFAGPGLDNPLAGMALRGVDWNVPLATVNQWMDRFVEAARIEDRQAREAAADQVVADLRALAAGAKEPWSLVGAVASRRRMSEKVGEIAVALLFPAISAVFNAESRTQVNDDLLRIGVALARYKAENGSYPEKLDALVPKQLSAVPTDAFSGGAFVYMRREDGYRLYSFGANKKDEQGRSYDQQGDDQVIELPRRVKAKPAPAETSEAEANAASGSPE